MRPISPRIVAILVVVACWQVPAVASGEVDRFTALLRTPFDGSYPRETSIGEFSTHGSLLRTITRLQAPVDTLAIDVAGGRYFGVYGHDVYQIDPVTGNLSPLPARPPELPELSWPSGLAFDSKRNRLFVASFGGVGVLYGYAPDEQRWSVVRSLNNVDVMTMTYSEAHDSFFGLDAQWKTMPRIMQLDANGAITRTFDISRAAPSIDHRFSTYQLVSIGDQLGLLTSPFVDPQQPDQLPHSWLYVIAPESGNVTFAAPISIPEPGILMMIMCPAYLLRRRTRRGTM